MSSFFVDLRHGRFRSAFQQKQHGGHGKKRYVGRGKQHRAVRRGQIGQTDAHGGHHIGIFPVLITETDGAAAGKMALQFSGLISGYNDNIPGAGLPECMNNSPYDRQ